MKDGLCFQQFQYWKSNFKTKKSSHLEKVKKKLYQWHLFKSHKFTYNKEGKKRQGRGMIDKFDEN